MVVVRTSLRSERMFVDIALHYYLLPASLHARLVGENHRVRTWAALHWSY
jgi:hypothetical protein